MINGGSCDTEDWSNYAENSALYDRNKLHFKIYSNIKPLLKMAIIFNNIPAFNAFFTKCSNGEHKRLEMQWYSDDSKYYSEQVHFCLK